MSLASIRQWWARVRLGARPVAVPQERMWHGRLLYGGPVELPRTAVRSIPSAYGIYVEVSADMVAVEEFLRVDRQMAKAGL